MYEKYRPKLNSQIYFCGSSFKKTTKKHVLYLLNEILFDIFSIIVLDVTIIIISNHIYNNNIIIIISIINFIV